LHLHNLYVPLKWTVTLKENWDYCTWWETCHFSKGRAEASNILQKQAKDTGVDAIAVLNIVILTFCVSCDVCYEHL